MEATSPPALRPSSTKSPGLKVFFVARLLADARGGSDASTPFSALRPFPAPPFRFLEGAESNGTGFLETTDTQQGLACRTDPLNR